MLSHKFCLLIQLLSFLVFALGHLASPRRQQEVLHAFIPVFQESVSSRGLAAEIISEFFLLELCRITHNDYRKKQLTCIVMK